MDFKPLLLFFLNVAIADAQQIHIKGSVIDSATSQPIPGATVGLINRNLFYRAGEDGQFDLAGSNTDSLSFSCIGYKTQKIAANKVDIKGSVKLVPINATLSEVKIAYKPATIVKVGSKKGSAFMSISALPGMLHAMYMKGSENAGGTIKSVGFQLGNGNILAPGRGDVTVPFRIRIFDADTSGLPGLELTKDIIVTSARHGGWLDVDVSAYRIKNPQKGFYVAFCLLNDEYYVDQNAQKNRTEFYSGAYIKSPRLSGTKNDDKELVSFTGTEGKDGIHWHKISSYNETLIRSTVEVD